MKPTTQDSITKDHRDGYRLHEADIFTTIHYKKRLLMLKPTSDLRVSASPGSIAMPITMVLAMKPAMKNLAKSLPLFESAKRSALHTLYVRRFENGRWLRVPGTFTHEELPDRASVQARFGGGRYEIIGRDGSKIVARTRFVENGPPRPLSEAPLASPQLHEPGPRAFATATGEREALVFALLDEGLDVVDVTLRTGIDARTVRAIFEEWLAPLGERASIEARRAALAAHRTAELEQTWEASWSSQA